MIRDNWFLWPYKGADLGQPAAELFQVLKRTHVKPWLMPVPGQMMLSGTLSEFMAMCCRKWNINPWWLVVCARREQPAAFLRPTDDPCKAWPQALLAWLGVTGDNWGRVNLPGYYGVYQQVERCCELSAWLLGTLTPEAWPEYWRTTKENPRYKPGLKTTYWLSKEDKRQYLPLSRGEYLQCKYTSSDPKLVLRDNETFIQEVVPVDRR
jgi:hypothetical protein